MVNKPNSHISTYSFSVTKRPKVIFLKLEDNYTTKAIYFDTNAQYSKKGSKDLSKGNTCPTFSP